MEMATKGVNILPQRIIQNSLTCLKKETSLNNMRIQGFFMVHVGDRAASVVSKNNNENMRYTYMVVSAHHSTGSSEDFHSHLFDISDNFILGLTM